MIIDIGLTNLTNTITLYIGILCIIIALTIITVTKDFIFTDIPVICFVITLIIGVICLAFSTKNETEQIIKTNKTAPFETIQQYIHVEKDKIIIDKLPDEYKFKKIDNIQPSNKETNIFTFIEDSTYNKHYLVNYKGEKYILNEHDAQFIKTKQNALDKTP